MLRRKHQYKELPKHERNIEAACVQYRDAYIGNRVIDYASMLGIVVMCSLFFFWLGKNLSSRSGLGIISAALCALLFLVLWVRYIPVLVDEWVLADKEKEPSKIEIWFALKVFVAMLGVAVLMSGLIFVVQVMTGSRETLWEALDIWKLTDGGHYLDIAEDWYLSEGDWDRLVQLVFLPGYPLVIRLAEVLIGNYLYAAILVSIIFFAASGSLLYCLIRLDTDHEEAVRALKYLSIFPGALFFVGAMSESFFLFLCVLCIFLIRKKKWEMGCAVGAVAAFTRSLGIILLVPIVFELIQDFINSYRRGSLVLKVWIPHALSVLFVPCGFLLYCLICKQISGDPFKFLEYEKLHWSQELGLFFNTAAYQMENAIQCFKEQNYEMMMGLWLPGAMCLFGCLFVMGVGVKRIRPSYTAFFMCYYLVAMGTTWLLSAPRYLAACFPVSIGLASISRRVLIDQILTVILSIFEVLYIFMFVWRWQVW